MGRDLFVAQLEKLGIQVRVIDQSKVAFTQTITSGKHAGEDVDVGFDVPPNFPENAPTGPHIKRQVWPIRSGGNHPDGGIHASAFGAEWQYWSRPVPNWHISKRSAQVVLAHLTRLLATQ